MDELSLKPSEQLRGVLTGAVAWDDAPAAIRSWARFEVYKAACEVLEQPTKGDRRNMLARMPAFIRGRVEAEAKRVFSYRQKKSV